MMDSVAQCLALWVQKDNIKDLESSITTGLISANLIINKEGMSLLHYAASLGKLESLALFLQQRAFVQSIDHSQKTALHHAVLLYDNTKVSHMLLNSGAKIEAKDKQGRQPLHCAIYKNNMSVVQTLLDRDAPINATDYNNRKPVEYLFWSARAALKGVEEIKGMETPINVIDSVQSMVLLLIERGADFSHSKGLTALHDLVMITSLCLEKVIAEKETTEVIINKFVSVAKFLVQYGEDIDKGDAQGRTPLHYVVILSCSSIIESLVSLGANMELPDAWGQKPFYYAMYTNREKALRELEMMMIEDLDLKSVASFRP